ncbi:hypothetical protein TL16_g09157, partial [Triparma laevis f. inornata]|uniref:GST C-terminal domain-containing protein n=2 Tax=Triparma laevis TaxID=1534972 RepID=A0A9W6ZC85_9STRA
MVYVTNGQINHGHRPQTTDEYVREPTRFAHNEILDVGIDSDLHLYVCAACPWAHRALLVRNLSDTLKRKVEVSVVSPFRDDDVGWEFKDLDRFEGYLKPTVDKSKLKAKRLVDVYLESSPGYTGNITTPVLYDAKENRILSNDSFGIMRLFSQAVEEDTGVLYKEKEVIDEEAKTIDEELGKRVYMVGMAKTQEAYESSLNRVFKELDRLEGKLTDGRKYLLGSECTLVDIQVIAVLVRFDPVYFTLFKCFTRRLKSYPLLSA